MIVKKQFMDQLKSLGLNSYEVKIWTALLSRGVSTAGELSDIANVPRSRSYDVLESLEKKGFVVMKIGKPIKYLAVPPKEVLERVKKNVKTDAERQVELLKDLDNSEVIEELSFIHKTGIEKFDSEDLAGSIQNKDSMYTQIATLVREAQEEILIATTKDHFEEKMNYLKDEVKKAHKRGVSIKIAAPVSENPLKDFAELKKVDLKARFCIVDKKSVLFMLTEGSRIKDPGIWLSESMFSKALADLFELAWKEN